MRDITIKVFKFDELKPELQTKVLETNRYSYTNDSDWSDHIIDNWNGKLELLGFHGAVIHWSGFYSQGDGACFDATIDVDSFACMMSSGLAKVYADGLAMKLEIQANNYAVRYSHSSTRQLYSSVYSRDIIKINKSKRINLYRQIDTFNDALEQLRHDLCNLIYKDLQTEYEYLTSDDQVREFLIAMEYEFHDDGTLFTGV